MGKGRLKITENYDNIDWKPVILVLSAYAYSLLGEKKFSNRRENLAYEFAMESITRYLENPEKFDPSRNPDLIYFLKFNLLRRLVSNFKELSYVKTRIDLDTIQKDNDDESNYNSLEELYFYENSVPEEIDISDFVAKVEQKLTKDPDLKDIFTELYYRNSKRSEICDDLLISLQEYNNRLRRLKRFIDKEWKLLFKKRGNG